MSNQCMQLVNWCNVVIVPQNQNHIAYYYIAHECVAIKVMPQHYLILCSMYCYTCIKQWKLTIKIFNQKHFICTTSANQMKINVCLFLEEKKWYLWLFKANSFNATWKLDFHIFLLGNKNKFTKKTHLWNNGWYSNIIWKSFSEQTSRSRWWTAHLKLRERLPLIWNENQR